MRSYTDGPGSLDGTQRMNLAAIVQARIRAAVSTLEHCEAALRGRCDASRVHALRVAVRRLRALLWSIKPWVRRDRYRSCTGHLKALARLLAPARDFDVIREVLLSQVTEKPGVAGSRQLLGADTTRQRMELRRSLRAAIRTARYEQGSRQLRELLVSPGLFRASMPTKAAPWRRRVLRDVARFDKQARCATNKDLHRIRIHAKRCRYSLEALAPDAPRKALHRLKILQTVLGSFCDARLAVKWLEGRDCLHDQSLRKRLLRTARALARQRARASLRALHETCRCSGGPPAP